MKNIEYRLSLKFYSN